MPTTTHPQITCPHCGREFLTELSLLNAANIAIGAGSFSQPEFTIGPYSFFFRGFGMEPNSIDLNGFALGFQSDRAKDSRVYACGIMAEPQEFHWGEEICIFEDKYNGSRLTETALRDDGFGSMRAVNEATMKRLIDFVCEKEGIAR